jgi:hypothetical protein
MKMIIINSRVDRWAHLPVQGDERQRRLLVAARGLWR